MADAPSRWLARGTVFPTLRRDPRLRSGWFAEGLTPHEFHCHKVARTRFAFRSAYQDCVVADTRSFGRALVLDGEMQSTELDEFIYHETLVHPAMLAHPRPRRVLIMGGGEGATLREVLRYRSVEQAVMADIDGEVLALCQRHFPSWHKGSFADPRVRLLIEDAASVVRRGKVPFDAIFSDLPSAIRGGPAYRLYTREFYRVLKSRLAPGGLFALQAGSGQLLQLDFHKALAHTLTTVFRFVRPYYAHIPSFDVPWAFLVCSDDPRRDPKALTAGGVDQALRRRGIRGLGSLDGEALVGMFRAPLHLRRAVAAERRVIREGRPVYFF